jgi:hypothetical protein
VLNYLSAMPWRRVREWRYSSIILDGSEWSASRHCRFTPRDSVLGAHWIGDWVGSRTGLDAVKKIKLFSLPGIEPHSLYLLTVTWLMIWGGAIRTEYNAEESEGSWWTVFSSHLFSVVSSLLKKYNFRKIVVLPSSGKIMIRALFGKSRDSSVCITMTQTTGALILVGARDISFLHSVQTGPGANPA